ncbi:hypothetical protein C3L33_15407, partial [Rhododendron williamsianum]
MLTFEGQMVRGVEDISFKLNQLPFGQCQHEISTIDSQPSVSTGGIMELFYMVQMFHLIPTIQGSFFVQNDIFRLNYG